MALDKSNVAVAVTGAVSVGELTATAPTGTAGTLTGFTDLGYISEDGITETLPESGEAEKIRAWQNGAEVRLIGQPSDDSPEWSFTLIETKLEVIELAYGVTVNQTATEGDFVIDANTLREHKRFVIDVVDGAELERIYIPEGEVVSLGERSLSGTGVIGYEITLRAHYDQDLAGHAKVWMTRLKSGV